MSVHTPKLAALIASRICHDLISPVGAISNGLELMSLSGNSGGLKEEIGLISESCANANARIRFFRIAFGMANDVARVSEAECRSVLREIFMNSRIDVDWQVSGDMPRTEVQLAFLAVQCAETAIAYGGQISCRYAPGRWDISATGERVNSSDPCWQDLDRLARSTSPDTPELRVSPAQVQFALLPLLAKDLGRRPNCSWSDQGLTLTV